MGDLRLVYVVIVGVLIGVYIAVTLVVLNATAKTLREIEETNEVTQYMIERL
jgi:capsular polysaccharide biosynthesis protein